MRWCVGWLVLQAESPDDYIRRVRRGVAEQIRQDNIIRTKMWMDELKFIIAMLLLFAFGVLVLAGLAAAAPQPVAGDAAAGGDPVIDPLFRLGFALMCGIAAAAAAFWALAILPEWLGKRRAARMAAEAAEGAEG